MTEREAIDRIKWKYEKCDGCNRNQIDIDTWNLAIKALEAVEVIKGMEYQYEWYDDEKSAWERGYNACLTEIKRLTEGDTDDSK